MSKIKSYILAGISIAVSITGLVLAFTLNEFFKGVLVEVSKEPVVYNIRLIDLNLVGAVFLTLSCVLSILCSLALVIPKMSKIRSYVFIISFSVLVITAITFVCLKLFNFKFDAIDAENGSAIRFGAGSWICLSCFLVSRSLQILLALKNRREN